jgi:hypothetical protein
VQFRPHIVVLTVTAPSYSEATIARSEIYYPDPVSGGWNWGALFREGYTNAETDPVGYVRADDINAVVYMGADYDIHELRLDGDWTDTDLSLNTLAPQRPLIPRRLPL